MVCRTVVWAGSGRERVETAKSQGGREGPCPCQHQVGHLTQRTRHFCRSGRSRDSWGYDGASRASPPGGAGPGQDGYPEPRGRAPLTPQHQRQVSAHTHAGTRTRQGTNTDSQTHKFGGNDTSTHAHAHQRRNTNSQTHWHTHTHKCTHTCPRAHTGTHADADADADAHPHKTLEKSTPTSTQY